MKYLHFNIYISITVMLNLFQHLIYFKTLKQVQGDEKQLVYLNNLNHLFK